MSEAQKVQAIQKFKEPAAGLPVPMDMTDILTYQAMIEDITTVNNMNGPLYMREFLKAKEMASAYHAKLVFEYEQAKKRRREAEAIALLERAPDYLKEKGIKETDTAKQAYVQIDKDYQAAKDVEDLYLALSTMFEEKVKSFQAAHDDAKAIFNATKDPRGSAPALPSGRDT